VNDQQPSQDPEQPEDKPLSMRLVKVECTGNDISAVGYVPETSDEIIIDQVLSWKGTPADAFEGNVYVALNIPAPLEFDLDWGAFYFYVPPELGMSWCKDEPGDISE